MQLQLSEVVFNLEICLHVADDNGGVRQMKNTVVKKLVADLALKAAKITQYGSCWIWSKQPKVPKELDKFMK